jgi:hypothetical protein
VSLSSKKSIHQTPTKSGIRSIEICRKKRHSQKPIKSGVRCMQRICNMRAFASSPGQQDFWVLNANMKRSKPPEPVQDFAVDDEWLTRSEAAQFLKRAKATLDFWAVTGQGPRFYRQLRFVRYRRSDLVAWSLRNPVDGATA